MPTTVWVILIMALIIIGMGVALWLFVFRKKDAELEVEDDALVEEITRQSVQIELGRKYIKDINKKIEANQEHEYKSVEELVNDVEMPSWMRE